jgi:hypothetical protein
MATRSTSLTAPASRRLCAWAIAAHLIAQDLIAWTRRLEGELANCEPEALRYRPLRHRPLRYRPLRAAGRRSFQARRAVLRHPANWPLAGEVAAARIRLKTARPLSQAQTRTSRLARNTWELRFARAMSNARASWLEIAWPSAEQR